MDRISFYSGISGNNDPHVFVKFFDQFVALYNSIHEFNEIDALGPVDSQDSIAGFAFKVNFSDKTTRDRVVSCINPNLMVYKKPMSLSVESLTDVSVNIIIK